MSHVNVGTPRAMVATQAGIRPPSDPKQKAALKSGGLFVNLADNVLCVGTGSGGYIVFSLTRSAVVPGNG